MVASSMISIGAVRARAAGARSLPHVLFVEPGYPDERPDRLVEILDLLPDDRYLG